jgi:hypothetical protein
MDDEDWAADTALHTRTGPPGLHTTPGRTGHLTEEEHHAQRKHPKTAYGRRSTTSPRDSTSPKDQ